ncbi:hypothetical protein [Limnoglobus roseus]|uniref:Uncharacterized protein n=1 Tax=Limnoglobus roseus TaxID=2598579 RepID=A0A5C1AH23_9BACT|nr:hypothetical protein [Limnoglobus roseus]QEL18719.1 hypothetical protein PX52LOC_05755 [Limnoglobus roseus]
MADLSDVENALVAAVTQAIYPTGTGNPSVANADCRVYRGWPIPASLDTDLAAGKINVTVFPLDPEQKMTRYTKDWQLQTLPTPALTLTASGTTITVGGTSSSPLNAAALVNRKGYVYAVQPGDTPSSIATALAALINADTPATSVGAVVTIPAAKQLAARVGAVGTVIRETKRQKRTFQITFWCPNPTLRDAIVAPVDAALAGMERLSLPDGTGGRLLYERSRVSDRVERAVLYRRDLFYSVEYATTNTQSASQIVAELFNLTGGLDPSNPAIATFTI